MRTVTKVLSCYTIFLLYSYLTKPTLYSNKKIMHHSLTWHVINNLLFFRRSEAVLRQTLPAKEEYVVPVKMSPIQMSLYNAFVSSVKNYVGYVNPIRAFSISIKVNFDLLFTIIQLIE